LESWKQQLRARLEKHIAALRLSPQQRATLLEQEFRAAVQATEAGQPFGATAEKPPVDEESEENFESVPA
jgi:ribosomal protein L9